MDLDEPSAEHLLLLNMVYAVFEKDGTWPVYDYLDRQLDRQFRVAIGAVLETVPNGLLRVYTPIRDDTEIMLRVAGMLYCNNADGDVELFMRALRWCVAKEASFEPASPTASEKLEVPTADVAQDWAKDGNVSTPLDFEKLRRMFIAEWVDVSGQPPRCADRCGSSGLHLASTVDDVCGDASLCEASVVGAVGVVEAQIGVQLSS
jgi:hypothetical protein